MPKMKTKSGAKKRLRVRGSGSVKRGQAFKRHILTKKSTKSKRQLRGTAGRRQVADASFVAVSTAFPSTGALAVLERAA